MPTIINDMLGRERLPRATDVHCGVPFIAAPSSNVKSLDSARHARRARDTVVHPTFDTLLVMLDGLPAQDSGSVPDGTG